MAGELAAGIETLKDRIRKKAAHPDAEGETEEQDEPVSASAKSGGGRPDKGRKDPEKEDGRGLSGRITEPDWETVPIENGMQFLSRLHEIYQRGATTLDARRSEQSKGRCSVCLEPFPEGRHRGEKVFSSKTDPMRYEVFRTCTDRCSVILDQNIQVFRSNDQGALARLRKDYFSHFVQRVRKPKDE